jgi:1-acylglycerone phosphate reductase
MSQEQKWALVTGVNEGGMGDAHVHSFLERNVNVVATSLDLGLLNYLQTYELKSAASLQLVELDVTNAESIAAAVEKVERVTGGRLDFLMSK